MKVLCIGHASYDISMPVPEYPIENKKYRVEKKVEGGGGPAATAAYLLGKWGIETYFAGVVGNDLYGNRIKHEFETVGVYTKFIETNYEQDTTLSFILINEKTGTRTLFNYAQSYAQITKISFDIEPDVILIDGHDYKTSLYALNRFKNAITIIDAGRTTPEVLDLCTKVKYLVCSREFAETVTGIKIDYTNTATIIKMYQALKSRFKNEIVVTLESKGALYCVNNQIKIMPALVVKALDTTGAGDIFHGAFTYGLATGKTLEQSIKLANMAAGLSITMVGSRNSVFKLEEIETYAKNINESIY